MYQIKKQNLSDSIFVFPF